MPLVLDRQQFNRGGSLVRCIAHFLELAERHIVVIRSMRQQSGPGQLARLPIGGNTIQVETVFPAFDAAAPFLAAFAGEEIPVISELAVPVGHACPTGRAAVPFWIAGDCPLGCIAPVTSADDTNPVRVGNPLRHGPIHRIVDIVLHLAADLTITQARELQAVTR